MLPLALQKIENEYLLFGSAGVLCLAVFIGLILVPAVSSYGRIWEKAAAGVRLFRGRWAAGASHYGRALLLTGSRATSIALDHASTAVV